MKGLAGGSLQEILEEVCIARQDPAICRPGLRTQNTTNIKKGIDSMKRTRVSYTYSVNFPLSRFPLDFFVKARSNIYIKIQKKV